MPEEIVEHLLALTQAARERLQEDPFGNPVLAMSLAISRMMDQGALDLDRIAAVIRTLRDDAYRRRAERLAAYVGGTDLAASDAAMDALAGRIVRPDPADSPISWKAFRAQTEHVRFAAVFTAHPTFSMPPAIGQGLAEMASGGAPPPSAPTHRPTKPTLEEEFRQATEAIARGRDAIDRFSAALLRAAAAVWPDRWSTLVPRPVILTSWVGYDTDGRTDIAWWDTLRLRLRMKSMQLARLAGQTEAVPGAAALTARLRAADETVRGQIDACPAGREPDVEAIAQFARALATQHEAAIVSTAPLMQQFAEAIAAETDRDARTALAVARAGLAGHGLSLAHTHVRLNATQLHNALRQRAGIDESVDDNARRRILLSKMNAALDRVRPEPVDFGSLLTEASSAARLMMTVAQIIKHIDNDTPVRFLIAETESGYTLLCALWLARLFGIEDRVQISPLFETADALERGARVLDEALRNPHWREYLRRTGTLSLQFGYSDSGRYVGQLAASYLIERLRLKIAETLAKHRVTDVEVILFDTHGESIGRGAHPLRLIDRLKYLSPTRSRKELTRARLLVREESAFQGGDGYLFFGTEALARATVARIAEHAFDEDADPDADRLPPDPVYDDPDFAQDFFTTIQAGMTGLVNDPGYAALLGSFGPALLDPTGSRPSARQMDGVGGPAMIRHPRELRAIPNNAIVQQMGWCANTLQGLGAAVARHPQEFAELMVSSNRFRRAVEFATYALQHSDLDVLHAVIAMLDPKSWLDRASHAAPAERERMIVIARTLEAIGMWASALAMLRRIQADHLTLRGVWPDAPVMETREMLLHALRLTLIQKIWMLSTEIPDFAARSGATRDGLEMRMLRLDVQATLDLLRTIFPERSDPAADRDFYEPRAPRPPSAYADLHARLFEPIARMFSLVREIGTAVSHEIGAFG